MSDLDDLRAVLRKAADAPGGPPIRQKSAKGIPRPFSEFTRRCRVCSACFLGLAAGKTGERGIWNDWGWYCSQECYDTSRTYDR